MEVSLVLVLFYDGPLDQLGDLLPTRFHRLRIEQNDDVVVSGMTRIGVT